MTDFEPEVAYPELLALACKMRPDWEREALRDAMTAVHTAGWPWKQVYREVMRLVWTKDEGPATLRNSARRPAMAAATGPEVGARGRAAVMAAIEEAKTRNTISGAEPENQP